MLSFREVHTNTTDPPLERPTGVPGLYQPAVYTPDASTGRPGCCCQVQTSGGTQVATPTATSANLYYLATCDASVQVGSVVTSGDTGGVVLADSDSPKAAIGIVTAKASATQATVQTLGEVTVGLTGLTQGTDYFVGTQGGLVAAPLDGIRFAQRVGIATSATSLYLAKDGRVVRRGS